MSETPIDADVLSLLAELPTPDAPLPASQQTAEQLRQTMRDSIAVFTRGAAPIVVPTVTDETAPGRHGGIPVRIYSPDEPESVLVYLHGGAWIVGDIDTHDFVTRRLCRDTSALVVSVDYRMLPEDPFPAPVDDAYDAVVWASSLRPDLPFLVGGDSAGGTLAACVALRARDESGPRIDAQVLVYPGIDDDYDAPSMQAVDGPNTPEDIEFFIDNYAGTDAARASSYALPARAATLVGLPPAIIAIAGHDVLRSSEEAYAARLAQEGVDTTVLLDPELTHSWIDYAPRVPAADRAFTRLTDAINDRVSRVAGPS